MADDNDDKRDELHRSPKHRPRRTEAEDYGPNRFHHGNPRDGR